MRVETRDPLAPLLFDLAAKGLTGLMRSLIALWCESNGIELPKRQGNCRTKKCGGSSLSDCDRTAIGALLDKLTSNDIEQQRAAAGKKDAATALIKLLCEGTPTGCWGGMVDEALAIMAILASHHEGRVAIGQAKPIHILVEVIRTGSPRNRENVVAVLWSLCTGDPLQLKLAKEHGTEAALQELSENGTDRAKRKLEAYWNSCSEWKG
ncbi:U-box domain-containing protein 14-like [Glycine max]|uniref:U-box domain-containing protein 14-like n=1 Tax=Glycine max TaxID=3847 RepID=UPI001B355CB5|nr:U-box domain-containing protein 14-like [Glycine max]